MHTLKLHFPKAKREKQHEKYKTIHISGQRAGDQKDFISNTLVLIQKMGFLFSQRGMCAARAAEAERLVQAGRVGAVTNKELGLGRHRSNNCENHDVTHGIKDVLDIPYRVAGVVEAGGNAEDGGLALDGKAVSFF